MSDSNPTKTNEGPAAEGTAKDDGKKEERTDVTVAEPPEAMETINVRVLKPHEIPPHTCDWVEIRLPVSKMQTESYSPLIDIKAENALYMVSHLGRGCNGDVWFAITPDAKRCCAVKFFLNRKGDPRTAAQKARAELENWEKVYGSTILPKCHIGNIHDSENHSYLCMPYIGAVPKHLWPMIYDFTIADVEAALRRFTNVGLKQCSMRWEHLGFFPKPKDSMGGADLNDDDAEIDAKGGADSSDDESEINEENFEIYIFDLRHLEPFQDGEDKEAWIRAAIKKFLSDYSPPSPLDLRMEGRFHQTFLG